MIQCRYHYLSQKKKMRSQI